MWGVRAGIQVSRKELHTHIHLDYVKVEILSCIKKNGILYPAICGRENHYSHGHYFHVKDKEIKFYKDVV